MPAPLAKALLPFQREGVRFGVKCMCHLLLADEGNLMAPNSELILYVQVPARALE